MSTHFNGLSPAQAERLALLLEELGEAQQAIGKILRHGYESEHPLKSVAKRQGDNRSALMKELGDVFAAMDLLVGADDLDNDDIQDAREAKCNNVGKYLHHAKVPR